MSLPLRVIGVWEREHGGVTSLKCRRCGAEQAVKLTARETAHVLRGTVLERTIAGDVPYPASLHHVCGLPGLYGAPLAGATRIISILDPSQPQPVELVGHDAKTLTLRFHDVVCGRDGFVVPEREHVAALLDFDRGAKGEDSLVVHCHAGLSRSTAALVALLAQRRPGAAAAAFAELRAVRSRSWPKYRIVAFADDLLDTGGALSRELSEHRKLMAERYPDLLTNAKATGHDGVWTTGRKSRRATSNRYGLRLIIVSDAHEQHAGLVIPDGDVFIHCGDFTYNGDLEAIGVFGTWLASLSHRHKLIIAGNHDFAFEHVPAPARRAVGSSKNGVRYLQDSGVLTASRSGAHRDSRGSTIGLSICLAAHDSQRNWRKFRTRPTYSSRTGRRWEFGSGSTWRTRWLRRSCGPHRDRPAEGSRVRAYPRRSGVLVKDRTTYVNASICDGVYEPVNPVGVVDI